MDTNYCDCIKTNEIMILHMPKVSNVLQDRYDDVKFVMDMEEPVCEGSEDDNHLEHYPHRITDVFFGFLEIFIKETTVSGY